MSLIFSFCTGSTTFFAALLYLAIFTFLYVTQYGPSVPPLQKQLALGFDLGQAYQDLHRIAERPHPYNSRQNDIVRHFLLERIREIAKGHDFIHVEDDVQTNAGFLDGSRAVYFQGNNILVKVDGIDDVAESGDAVLFSAHFDSVSTAPGATDNGMSVVALMRMMDFLSRNRPRRTAVFNINNGEEDGLHGAQTFLRHPWSNLTSTFLNFEGAGSGGRPFLFRSTSYDVLKFFRSAPHIHADVLSQDAWDQGVIRSDTDYSVYAAPRTHNVFRASKDDAANGTGHGYEGPGGGMQGADIAFYRSRSRYHTMDDSIRGMGDEGAMRSLWALMELLRFVGDTILNTKAEDNPGEESERAVYFEIFGIRLIAFRFRAMMAAAIVLLVVGPVIIAGLGYLASSPTSPLLGSYFRGYGRFWLALIPGASTQTGLVFGFLKLNPNTAHGHPVGTSLSALALAYLSLAVPLQLAQHFRPIPASKQRFVILIELYGLTWLLLVGATMLMQRIKVAGFYWVAFWNASLLVAVALGLSERLWSNGKAVRSIPRRGESESDQAAQTGEHQEAETTENTPLLRQRAFPTISLAPEEKGKDFWWILQFIISSTLPVLNLATIYAIWIGAMPQTIPDGGWVGIVYAPISLLSFLVLLPMAPFVHRVHRSLSIIIFFIFIASTSYVWLASPFTPDARLRVFFAQKVELTNVSSAVLRPELTRAITQLNVIEGYGPRLVATLPSSWSSIDDGDDGQCKTKKLLPGLTTCEWIVPPALLPSITSAGDDEKGTWLVGNVTRLGPVSLRIEIEGVQTRACSIHVDSHGIRRYRARARPEGGTEVKAGGPTPWTTFEVPGEKEIHLLTLWARRWGSKFEVELDVDPDTDEEGRIIAGRVSCLWNDGPGGAEIPALEEARRFLPEWVAISKAADGLVEAASGFVVR